MRLLAIDPGPVESAYVLYDTERGMPLKFAKVENEHLLRMLDGAAYDELAVEMVASYGMAVGAEVFETCVWAGRFIERCRWPSFLRVYRRDVKSHLCGSQRANDSNIRQALIDRYGPGKAKAVGLKASPGPMYKMNEDCRSALGVAITATETMLDARVAA